MCDPWSVAIGGSPCRYFQSAHNKHRSMNNGTNTRRLFGMHSSDVFSFALECMPDKIAGQAQISARIRVPFLIGKMGGIAQLVERLVRNEKARGSNPLTSSLRSRRGGERRLSRRSLGEGGPVFNLP